MKNKMRIIVFSLVLTLAAFTGCGNEKKAAGTVTDKEQTSSGKTDSEKKPDEESKDKAADEKDNEDQNNQQSQEQKEDTENKEPSDTAEGGQDSEPSEDQLQSMEEIAAEGQKDVEIYSSNDDADGLKKTTITISQLTPEGLLNELVSRGVVTGDIQVISCREVMVDGEKALDLDLSKSFETYLNSMGTAGERITVQSICNTYLNAFQCEKIRLTVEGQSLATGHAEYPGYLGFFE